MAFSHEDVSTQLTEIREIVKLFDDCTVVRDRITNKRMIIKCSGRNVANHLVDNLQFHGYPMATAAAGIKSTAYYVEVRFNYPF